MLLTLTKVLGAKQLRQAYDVGAGACGVAHQRRSLIEIRLRVRTAGHLDQANFLVLLHGFSTGVGSQTVRARKSHSIVQKPIKTS